MKISTQFARLAAIVVVAACASSSSSPTPETIITPMTQRVVSIGGTLTVNAVDVSSGSSMALATSVDSAWKGVKAVYAQLGIPVATLNEAAHQIGNDGFRTRRRIGKLRMQEIVDCGSTMGSPNAETYDILMSLSSYVAKAPGGGVNLVSRLTASGKSPNFSRDASVNCVSLGALEQELANLVKSSVK